MLKIVDGLRQLVELAFNELTRLTGRRFDPNAAFKSLTRDRAAALVVEAGGKVTGSLSVKTDYVVAGTELGSDLANVEALGIAVVDESGHRNLL